MSSKSSPLDYIPISLLKSCRHLTYRDTFSILISYLANLSFTQATFPSKFKLLSELHWLPVRHRVNFKIPTIAFKVLQFQQPSYLAALIPRYVPTRSLLLLHCHYVFLTGMAQSRSFSSVASSVWNKLLGHLSSISTLPAFRKRLEHHLFWVPFPVIPHHPLASCFVMSAHPQMRLRSDTPHRLANTSQLSAYD